MSGQDALPEIRRIRPDIPVLISSGFTETQTMRLFEGCRVSGFIQKPYTANRLAQKIKAVLTAP